MKIYIMKQDALETLKDNIEDIYGKYYTESTNKWIYDVCGGNPFVEYKEIPDFSLATIDHSSLGEVDFQNCKIIFTNLMFLSESQAGDERLWAGLTHTVFYDYMRQRYKYGYGRKPKSAEKESGEILSRFFYKSTGRKGFYRNTLAKAWWVGHNTYNPQNEKNHFEKLDLIGSNDISSKVLDLFENYLFSSNPHIMDGIAEGLRHFRMEGKALSTRNHIRPAMVHLNAVGGSLVLDCLETEEIADIFIDTIEGIMQGDKSALGQDLSVDEEDDVIDEDNNTTDENEALTVTLGCKICVKTNDGTTKFYKYDYVNGAIPGAIMAFTGKTVGDDVNINGVDYNIVDITLA